MAATHLAVLYVWELDDATALRPFAGRCAIRAFRRRRAAAGKDAPWGDVVVVVEGGAGVDRFVEGLRALAGARGVELVLRFITYDAAAGGAAPTRRLGPAATFAAAAFDDWPALGRRLAGLGVACAWGDVLLNAQLYAGFHARRAAAAAAPPPPPPRDKRRRGAAPDA